VNFEPDYGFILRYEFRGSKLRWHSLPA
jgi:hypothetical protein